MAGRIAYFGGIVTNGLVLNLDAAKLDSYPRTGTLWNDISGNLNNGTLINGPTFNSNNGGSIVFDGTNDYADLGNVGVTNFNAFSISFWAKKSTSTISSTAYAEGTPSSWPNNLFVFYFGTSEDTGKCRIWFGNGTKLISTTSVVNNSWYYVTYNQTSTANRTMLINAVSEATDTTSISHTATNAYIGASNNNGNMTQFGNQNLAYLHCYNRALSASEILQNFNATRGRFGI